MKLLKKAITSLLILTILSLMVISISQVKAASDINILSNNQGFIAPTGTYYIVGEVQNVGSQAQKFVHITATFYSSNGTMLGTDDAYTDLDIINPGCKSSFYTMLLGSNAVWIPEIDHYSLTVSSSVATALPGNLKILSSSSSISNGNFHVTGEIQNLGGGSATFVYIIATFYDQAGKVVGSESTYPDPDTIASGQKAPFDISYTPDARVPLIKSYALTAQSEEYSLQGSVTPSSSPSSTSTPNPTPSPSIPEFPQTIIMAVVGAMSLIIAVGLVTYRRRNSST